MTNVVRYTEILNGTATVPGIAILTSAIADNGDEFASQKVKRVFVAADIGTGSGQTQDTTSNPTLGCLVAQFTGSKVRSIINLELWRPTTATHVTNFNRLVIGTAANTTNLGLHTAYNAKTGVSSIYVLDAAAGAGGLIVANDWIEFEVLLGDTVDAGLLARPQL